MRHIQNTEKENRQIEEAADHDESLLSGIEHEHLHEAGTSHGISVHEHEHGGDGHDHVHEGSEDAHGHHHSHKNQKAVLNRLSRVIGHLNAVKRMVEDDRDCSEVLIQIAAVKSALNGIADVIIEEHINTCIVDAVNCGDKEAIDELNKAIKQLLKN